MISPRASPSAPAFTSTNTPTSKPPGYPAGSDAMGLLVTVLTGGRTGRTRIVLWLAHLAWAALRHPIRTTRLLQPFGFARESAIFLCMQTVDGHIDMRLRRRWFWPFRKIVASQGKKIPTFIPQANEFARKAATLTGGTAMNVVTEILLNVPSTAHVLGGCPIADSAADGVVDSRNRVFGQNMYICDGSVPAVNLGVNSSLTICAVTERAMSFMSPAEKADWNDSHEILRPAACGR